MIASRRNFIKTTGITALGIGILPSYARLENIFDPYRPVLLPRMSPESQGVPAAAILNFIKAANTSGLDWHSFMLLRHGKVIAEGWWKPFEPQFRHTLYSLSKSFTSTAIGLLVKEGRITAEDTVTSFFKDELPDTISDNLAQMKIRHLLTMNTGHGEDTMPKLRNYNGTWTKAFLAQPVQFQPGTHFLYNTGATYMLGAIVYKVTGETLEKYLASRLFQPLDIKGYDWEKSPQGLNTAGYGLRVKTEDIAKFGQLYLQKGKWEGKEILTENWIAEATRYQTSSNTGDSDWSQGYGYQFWRCKPGFYRGDGAYGQFCIVMPEQDAVLAVTSESWDMQKSMTTIWQTLLPAMEATVLKENPAGLAELKNELKSLSLRVPKGAVSSALASVYHSKKIGLESNEYGAREMQFKFSNKACTWTVRTGGEETTYRFGWEDWVLNPDSQKYIFPVAGRIDVPSKTAGTATWINERTLQLNLRFVEAIHGDKITCVFDDDKVSVSFLNSISENAKNNPEKRTGLSGTL
jgi:hypothetical protein